MKKKNKSSKKPKFKILKKIGRGIYTACEFIYNIIDKFIITPITKLMLFIMKIIKTNNKPFDRLLNNKMFLITFSLVLSLFVFFIVDNLSDTMIYSSADVLYNQKVNAVYNKESYAVEGLPETVDITIIGRKSNLYLAKQSPNGEVDVDLTGLKPGTHKVQLKYSGSVSSVEYKLDPSVATVVIYEKISEKETITKEILNENKLDSKYTISNISFDDSVYIKGPEHKIEEVAIVKALIDVEKIVNPTVGTTTLKEIPLVAYDKNGEKVDVEIIPGTIEAVIDITSISKEVNIKVVPTGNMPIGKSIESITLSENKITIYGEQSILDTINSINVPINVSNLTDDKDYNINIPKPTGIKEMSLGSVVAKVKLGDTQETTVDGINITTKNLASGYVVMASDEKNSIVKVIVKGTRNNITNINKDNITAFVNLQGLEEGTHEVEVQVEGTDEKLTYTPQTAKVTIVIRKS